MGQLAMNVMLARGGFPSLNVPYSGRRGYYRALERSSLTQDSRSFVGWMFRKYRASNKRFLPGRPKLARGNPPD